MAFIKEKITKFGFPASYWKIGSVTIDRNLKEASFILYLFFSKDAEEFIESHVVSSLMGERDKALYEEYFEDKEGKFKNIYYACYDYAQKYDDFFKDAEFNESDLI